MATPVVYSGVTGSEVVELLVEVVAPKVTSSVESIVVVTPSMTVVRVLTYVHSQSTASALSAIGTATQPTVKRRDKKSPQRTKGGRSRPIVDQWLVKKKLRTGP